MEFDFSPTRLLYNWIFVVTALVTQCASSAITDNGASGILDELCDYGTCIHGDCYVVGDEAKCSCGDMYRGEQCEIVNLDAVDLIIIGSMVIFKWPQPPRLKDYSFIYYCLDDPEMVILKHSIELTDRESSVLVGNFRDGIATYRICIDTERAAELAVRTQSTEYVRNCVNISTHMDYHSLFGWFLAVLSCIAAVTLVYFQKDKIELLYFHRPWILNNGYNYNVEELIRNEKLRKEKEYNAMTEDTERYHVEEGRLNKMPLETIADESSS